MFSVTLELAASNWILVLAGIELGCAGINLLLYRLKDM